MAQELVIHQALTFGWYMALEDPRSGSLYSNRIAPPRKSYEKGGEEKRLAQCCS